MTTTKRDVPIAISAELPYLLHLARRLTGNTHDASDLVQDALVRALRALPRLQAGGGEMRPWLATIVRHLYVDRLRQLAREPKPVPLEEAGPLAHDVDEDRSKDHDDDDVQRGARLAHALGKLPEEFRRVFVLHEIDGRSYRDIADALGIPMATVGTRLSRAKLKLRQLLGTHGAS